MHLPDRLKIPSAALVLEIGGGGCPHPRSSVLVDKFPGANGAGQRGGAPFFAGAGTVILADGSRLPFRDQQFDYVIASHVIEHIPPPEIPGFVRELQRVAPRGYLEAPSVVYEVIREIPEHQWFVHMANNIVHLAARGDPPSWTRLTDSLFTASRFLVAVDALADVFFEGMEWEESLSVQVHDTLDDLVAAMPGEWAADAMRAAENRARARRLQRTWFRRFAVASLPPFISERLRRAVPSQAASVVGDADRLSSPAWRDLVVCPVCHGVLAEEGDGCLDCSVCRRHFDVKAHDVPCLLAE